MILKKAAYILLLHTMMVVPALAQKWVDAGIPNQVVEIKTVSTDTINHKLYVGGFIPIDSNGNMSICIYDGNAWTVKDTIDNIVRSMEMYNNELYMGGDFIMINSQPMQHLVKWNGTNWINIGTSGGGVLNLRVINNELYAVGTFTQIAGIAANNIAKWNGTNWLSLNFPYLNQIGWCIGDCALYNGDLYAAGNFQTNSGLSDIAVLKSGIWERVGNSDSLRGTFSSLFKLEVFQNELYAGGYLLHSEGNVGNGIQRWDGTNWKTVGNSLQDYNNTTNSATLVSDMMQYKNKLYVAGGFSFAGNSIAHNMATWDGTKWCAIDTLIDKPITAFGIFNDTLFAGTNDIFEGTFVNSFAKFKNGNYSYSEKCSVNFDVGVQDMPYVAQFSIYPNPTHSVINIIDEHEQLQHSIIEIKNYLGQTVYTSSFVNQINISSLAAGMYFLTVQDKEKKRTVKVVKE
ncbi:MAG: T9SS type A sorting domain-containing protein [Bacteroidota bacterium]